MGLIDKILGGGLKGIASGVSGVIDSLQSGKKDKREAMLAIQEIADLRAHA